MKIKRLFIKDLRLGEAYMDKVVILKVKQNIKIETLRQKRSILV